MGSFFLWLRQFLDDFKSVLKHVLKTIDDRGIAATFTTPTVDDCALPALLGLKTLIEQGAIIDFNTMQLSFTGPGETRIDFSPETDTYQFMQAPSGHLMIPCAIFRQTAATRKGGLQLNSEVQLPVHTCTSASSSSAAPR